MPFPVLGSNSAVAGFEIDNSLRFNDDDNAFLSRTPSSSGSRTIATVSFWVKRGNLKASGDHFMLEASSSTSPFNMTRVRFSNDLLVIDNTLNGSAANGFMFQSNREYRDPSAFYHIFFSIDVTQANATDGWLLYVNGVQQTKALSFWTQNANLEFSQSSVQMNIGRRHDNTNDNLDGCLAEYHYIDGTRKLYTDFGEFNDNGVWIPKEYDGGSYGTNGFFLEFQDSGNLGDDTSGNGNDFTATNLTATDQTTDTPTNNFCTLNPLAAESGFTFSEGNLVSVSSTDNTTHGSTFAVRKGKWYWEVAFATHVDTVGSGIILVEDYTSNLGYSGATSYYFDANGDKIHNSTATSLFGNISNEGHLQYALDLDNGRFSFGFEGTWSNGSSAQSTTFNASDFDFTGIPTGVDYFIARGQMSGTSSTLRFNFGNPSQSFQGNGYTDANGYGNFQTPVPSGYYALCTKNLAEYG